MKSIESKFRVANTLFIAGAIGVVAGVYFFFSHVFAIAVSTGSLNLFQFLYYSGALFFIIGYVLLISGSIIMKYKIFTIVLVGSGAIFAAWFFMIA